MFFYLVGEHFDEKGFRLPDNGKLWLAQTESSQMWKVKGMTELANFVHTLHLFKVKSQQRFKLLEQT